MPEKCFLFTPVDLHWVVCNVSWLPNSTDSYFPNFVFVFHDKYHSTPLASKVHCSINGLENSSSPKYSKVQHLLRIAVGLFSAGVGLFSATVGLRKSPPLTKKSPTPIEKVLLWPRKVLLRSKKSPTLTQKILLWSKKSYLKKVLL